MFKVGEKVLWKREGLIGSIDRVWADGLRIRAVFYSWKDGKRFLEVDMMEANLMLRKISADEFSKIQIRNIQEQRDQEKKKRS